MCKNVLGNYLKIIICYIYMLYLHGSPSILCNAPLCELKAKYFLFRSFVLRFFLYMLFTYVQTVKMMTGKIMEQGPVLVINFTAQQIMVVRDSKGKVVEGDPVSGSQCQCSYNICKCFLVSSCSSLPTLSYFLFFTC